MTEFTSMLDPRIFESLRNSEGEKDVSLLESILRAIRKHLGMEVSFISHLRDGLRHFDVVDSDKSLKNLVIQGGSDPVESSYCQRVIDGRLPGLIPNAADLEEARKIPATQDIPVGAHLSVPIRLDGGEIHGTMCCFSRKADPSMNERDLGMLRAFADIVGIYLSRGKAAKRKLLALKEEILDIFKNDRLRMVYQPIIDIRSRHTVGFESLARFDSPRKQPPNIWFDQAQTAGLGMELELHAVEQAITIADQMPAAKYFSVNLSPKTILATAFDEILAKVDPN